MIRQHRIPVGAFGLAILFALSLSRADAQSVYGLDGGAATVLEMTGPPAACGYPTGPLLSAFPILAGFGCPLPGPVPPPPGILGDLAVNKATDTIWVTDGLAIGEYVASGPALGTPITGFVPLPFGGLITGLGFDSAGGLLWMTDGVLAQAVIPPPPPGCPGVGVVAIPPFPLPVAGPATDIEWDPLSGTLWVCDIAGMVTNVMIGGGLGPFGAFPAAPGPCGLMPVLQGLALDNVGTTLFGIPTMYVTDGFMVAYMFLGGIPAPPTFYTPAPCFPTMGPMNGLALAARALPYGAGADNSGAPAPFAGSIGQTISPNPAFTVTLSGSVPGSLAFLYLSTTGFYCPPPVILGLPVLIDLSLPPTLLGFAPVGALGTATFTTAIPPGFPPGVAGWLQWVAKTPLPSLQVSDALALNTDLP